MNIICFILLIFSSFTSLGTWALTYTTVNKFIQRENINNEYIIELFSLAICSLNIAIMLSSELFNFSYKFSDKNWIRIIKIIYIINCLISFTGVILFGFGNNSIIISLGCVCMCISSGFFFNIIVYFICKEEFTIYHFLTAYNCHTILTWIYFISNLDSKKISIIEIFIKIFCFIFLYTNLNIKKVNIYEKKVVENRIIRKIFILFFIFININGLVISFSSFFKTISNQITLNINKVIDIYGNIGVPISLIINLGLNKILKLFNIKYSEIISLLIFTIIIVISVLSHTTNGLIVWSMIDANLPTIFFKSAFLLLQNTFDNPKRIYSFYIPICTFFTFSSFMLKHIYDSKYYLIPFLIFSVLSILSGIISLFLIRKKVEIYQIF